MTPQPVFWCPFSSLSPFAILLKLLEEKTPPRIHTDTIDFQLGYYLTFTWKVLDTYSTDGHQYDQTTPLRAHTELWQGVIKRVAIESRLYADSESPLIIFGVGISCLQNPVQLATEVESEQKISEDLAKFSGKRAPSTLSCVVSRPRRTATLYEEFRESFASKTPQLIPGWRAFSWDTESEQRDTHRASLGISFGVCRVEHSIMAHTPTQPSSAFWTWRRRHLKTN